MAKLISPQGTVTTVSDSQVSSLVRIGWKRPQSKQEPAPEPKTESKLSAKRGRPSTSN